MFFSRFAEDLTRAENKRLEDELKSCQESLVVEKEIRQILEERLTAEQLLLSVLTAEDAEAAERIKEFRKEIKDLRSKCSMLEDVLSQVRKELEETDALKKAAERQNVLDEMELERRQSAIDLLEIQRDTLVQQVHTYLNLRTAENLAAAQTQRIAANADLQPSRQYE